ncbi:alpha/beta hydrolase [Solwaraspora sp. WMMD406]|uniref:alpha/beta hydrolase n=1 Tax=Solwaraspora sp. WMMD406 TaxID=3016095 RepID=UPI0024180D45|nr:alpha/beta hydrolase [Solwaraspora sp. WMMD406]MDG4763418.1 alpha/beta hydrolase [Solwaraspora sp. WMMD406]
MTAGIIVPGRGYGPQAPLLHLAGEALTDLGATIETITWTVPDGLLDIGPEPFVRVHVSAALHRLADAEPGMRPVIIGKSLGTYAAGLAAERQLPAIWLTPLLYDDAVTKAIARNPAPALLVGGTRDRTWVSDAAARTGKTVLSIEGADHDLRPLGPLRAYTEALGAVGTEMEKFLSQLT